MSLTKHKPHSFEINPCDIEIEWGTKRCGRCKMERPITEFYKNRTTKDGLATECKACRKAIHNTPRGRETARAALRRYYMSEKGKLNKERKRNSPLAKLRKARYRSKPDKIELEKKWRVAYRRRPEVRERERYHDRAKHAKRRNVPGFFTRKDLQRIFLLQKGRCAICRKKLTENEFHVDHIVAIANGGSNYPNNLQITCQHCNVKKWAKDPIEFMQSIGRLL